ncbi:hypothetical protein FRB99_005995 [Tulasnella sp. 403]|nr:hypothetical protein FRB99_005995 [Tulasnella sp. 403]
MHSPDPSDLLYFDPIGLEISSGVSLVPAEDAVDALALADDMGSVPTSTLPDLFPTYLHPTDYPTPPTMSIDPSPARPLLTQPVMSIPDTSAKRSADDDGGYHEDEGCSKKARVHIEDVSTVELEQDKSECLSSSVLDPTTEHGQCVTPPPRSPSPPRHLSSRPAISSPLSSDPPPNVTTPDSCPCPNTDELTLRPPTRRRSRSSEIALLKFALDPWLRLSRALEASSAAAMKSANCSGAFNPATYPSNGNLRELRRCDPFVAPGGAGRFNLSLPFSFGCDSTPPVSTGPVADALSAVKWSLVDV